MADLRFITSDNIPLDTSTDSDVYVEGQPLIYFSREQYARLLPCLMFTSPEPFTLATANAAKNWSGTLEYSTDASIWSTWDGTTTLSSSGNKLYVRGTGNIKITGGSNYRWILTGSNISCIGNIENLLDYQTVARGEHPTMTEGCYECMFQDCTSLITAPELPSTLLRGNCYDSMFLGCASLISPPALPATTLRYACYQNMFQGCTSLTTAPELPATTLADSCYSFMFYGCTSLTTAPTLSATTLAVSCYNSMFSNCTSLTSASALPATALANNCYGSMFYCCTSLISIPILTATTLTNNCYNNMFSGCSSIKLSSTQTGEYQIPYRIPASGTGTTGTDSLMAMFGTTGGTFKGTPDINTTYYLSTSNSIIPAN